MLHRGELLIELLKMFSVWSAVVIRAQLSLTSLSFMRSGVFAIHRAVWVQWLDVGKVSGVGTSDGPTNVKFVLPIRKILFWKVLSLNDQKRLCPVSQGELILTEVLEQTQRGGFVFLSEQWVWVWTKVDRSNTKNLSEISMAAFVFSAYTLFYAVTILHLHWCTSSKRTSYLEKGHY